VYIRYEYCINHNHIYIYTVYIRYESGINRLPLGLATTIHIQCIYVFFGREITKHIRCTYGIFGREITKYKVIYSVCIRFWPTPLIAYLLSYLLLADALDSRPWPLPSYLTELPYWVTFFWPMRYTHYTHYTHTHCHGPRDQASSLLINSVRDLAHHTHFCCSPCYPGCFDQAAWDDLCLGSSLKILGFWNCTIRRSTERKLHLKGSENVQERVHKQNGSVWAFHTLCACVRACVRGIHTHTQRLNLKPHACTRECVRACVCACVAYTCVAYTHAKTCTHACTCKTEFPCSGAEVPVHA